MTKTSMYILNRTNESIYVRLRFDGEDDRQSEYFEFFGGPTFSMSEPELHNYLRGQVGLEATN